MIYPKDNTLITEFIQENKNKDSFEKQDLVDISKMLIKQWIWFMK